MVVFAVFYRLHEFVSKFFMDDLYSLTRLVMFLHVHCAYNLSLHKNQRISLVRVLISSSLKHYSF